MRILHCSIGMSSPSSSCNEWISVFFSECVLSLRGYSPAPVRNSASDMNEVMEQLSTRQLALELQDRRCVAEARRNRVTQNKSLFRSKMLEHRRLQAQMAQLQRYRESALTHLDAVSNHEINQTFMRAIQGTVSGMKINNNNTDSATTAVEELQESLASVKEMSDLLGQPLLLLAGMESEVTDEDLDTEFMEYTALETITESPTTTTTCVPPPHYVVVNPTTAAAAVTTMMPSQELRTSVFERRGAGMV